MEPPMDYAPQGQMEQYGPGDYGPGGYPPDSYQQADPYGQQGQGYYSDSTPAGATQGDPEAYQRYTETATQSQMKGLGGGSIDPDTGIAPRRLTDCVCLVIFGLYVLGMMLLLLVVKNRTYNDRPYSDVRRLTHGMDYQARLCGVDAGVEDKPFLYWCREDPLEWAHEPSLLNFDNPSCVSVCPNVNVPNSTGRVACLFKAVNKICSSEDLNFPASQGGPCHIPGGQFGNVLNYHLQSQQSVAYSNPYETTPFGGRFCMPTNHTLRASILHGPMRPTVRAVNAMGSFQNGTWGVMFFSVLLAIGLGYLFVFLVGYCDIAKHIVFASLSITFVVFMASGLFFLYAICNEIPALKESLDFDLYESYNPLYTRTTGTDATILSCLVGFVLVCISCGVLGTMSHVGQSFVRVHELVRCASDCVFQMSPAMLIPPALEAVWKYILTWILLYNFMFLMSTGFVDDHRVVIDGEFYRGMSAKFYFDWSLLPWIVYYIYGACWILEICTAFGQFIVAFSVISWYFMKVENKKKTGVPPMPPVNATAALVVYHLGSLCLGAAIIPWARLVRIFTWIEDESVPDEKADGGGCCEVCRCCECVCSCFTSTCKFIGGLCKPATKCRKNQCTPVCCGVKGCSWRFNKNAYADIIIRSQHFFPASLRAMQLSESHKPCKIPPQGYMFGCQIISVIGYLGIGIICAFCTYSMILSDPFSVGFNDPNSDSYIQDPIAVSLVAFFLCGSIGYGFTELFDHTADTLLYCYAWNRKFNRGTVEKFCPDAIKYLVNFQMDQTENYGFYGRAHTNMYLSSWIPTKKKPGAKAKPAKPGATTATSTGSPSQYQPAQSQTGMPEYSYAGQPYATGGGYDTQGTGAFATGASAGGYAEYGASYPAGYGQGGYSSPAAGYDSYGGYPSASNQR